MALKMTPVTLTRLLIFLEFKYMNLLMVQSEIPNINNKDNVVILLDMLYLVM